MKDEYQLQFEEWYRKCQPPKTMKKMARAAWNAACHLVRKAAKIETTEAVMRERAENYHLRKMLTKAETEIDRLEAGQTAEGPRIPLSARRAEDRDHERERIAQWLMAGASGLRLDGEPVLLTFGTRYAIAQFLRRPAAAKSLLLGGPDA